MIYPFEIRFKKKLNVSPTINSHEVMSFISKAVTQGSPYLKNKKVTNNQFSFKVDFWGVGRGSDFDGVSKGTFTLDHENNGMILSFVYRIGSNMIIFPFIFVIPMLIVLFTDYERFLSTAPMLFAVTIGGELLFWFATLFKMNRIFRRMVRLVEANWAL